MANQIRFKRASGSDPGASDLVLGEPAVRTDTGELFFKKDDGSVAKVSGGVEDGDKRDITVSNSGATFTIDNDAVTYAKIQNVSATNRILGRDSSGAGAIEEITPANLRTMINVEDGATADQSASEIKTAYESNSDTNAFTDALLSKLNGIAASATNVTNNNQLTNGAGYITATLTEEQVEDFVGGMVTGNTETGITVTYQDSDGTLDFVVASQTDNNFTTTLKNKLDGIATGATNVTNTNQLTNGAGFLTSVSTSDIADGAITTAKIGNNAVSSGQINDNAVGSNQITSDAVVTSKIAAGAINTARLADDAVTTAKIADDAITTAQIADDAVNLSKIDHIDSGRILARVSSGLGQIETITASQLRTLINVADGATAGGGATGGGSDEVFYENGQTVTTNYTITNGKNAMAAGPITINSGVTVTVGSGETLTIV